jgi:hypothetical protein
VSPRIALAQSFAYEAESGDHGFNPALSTTPSSTQRYLIATVLLNWLALSLSEASSFRSSHVSLSTWVSHPASLSRSRRRSRTDYTPTATTALLLLPPLATERHDSETCAQAGLSRFDKWHRCVVTCRTSGRRDTPGVDHCRRSRMLKHAQLMFRGGQLANRLLGEGSPDALDVGRHISCLHTSLLWHLCWLLWRQS